MFLALLHGFNPILMVLLQIVLLFGLVLSIMEICVFFTPKIITAALIHLIV